MGLLVFVTFPNFGQNSESIKADTSIVYGNKEWMIKILKTSIFRNGDTIPEARTPEEWKQAGVEKRPAWCYYDNDSVNGIKYGKLYNWFAVNDPRGIAPEGWHVPSIEEWKALIEHFGGGNKRQYIPGTTRLKPQPPWGKHMKSEEGWINDGNGTNETGFSGLPAGSRNSDGSFRNTQQWYFGPLGVVGAWWASDTWNNEMAWIVRLKYNENKTFSAYQAMTFGLSVRIVKGNEIAEPNFYKKYASFLKEDISKDTINNNQITKDSLVYVTGSDTPFTGVVKGVSKSGILWFQNYIEGLKQGYYTSWYYPNKIKDFVTYKNGLGEGPAARWSIEGNPIFEGEYSNDVKDGKWTYWNKKKKTKEIEFYQNGKRDSLWVKWYIAGEHHIKLEEGSYKEGKREGTWNEWYEEGNEKSVTNYSNGKRHGLQKRWWKNGNMMKEETVVHGSSEGIIKSWHSNGQLQWEQKIENGKRIYIKKWDKDGNPIDN